MKWALQIGLVIFSLGILFCSQEETVRRIEIPKESQLHLAVRDGNVSLTERLLLEGAKVDSTDALGNTPLIMSVDLEELALVSLLVRSGANVNHRNIVGETALYRAVFRGNEKLVSVLLQAGANKTIVNAEGISPFELAEDRGEKKILKLLKSD